MTYTGPNRRMGDWYVREVHRTGKQRQRVHYVVPGTHLKGVLPRHLWDRRTRPA